MTQNFQRLTSGLDAEQRAPASIAESQQKLLARQDKSIRNATKQRREMATIRRDLCSTSRTFRREHTQTREQIVRSETTVIDTLSSKLHEMHVTTSKSTQSATCSEREITFIGESHESILMPLLLLRDKFRQSALQILSHDVEGISTESLYWLQSEFENLLSSATQEVAALSHGSTATPFDKWTYQRKTDSSSGPRLHRSTPTLGNTGITNKRAGTHAIKSDDNTRRKQLSGAKEFSFCFSLGKLRLKVARANDPSKSNDSVEVVGFSFIPSMNICTTAIAARFMKVATLGAEPRLYAQLNAYNVVREWPDRHIKLMWNGKVEDVDAAFRSGTISPYDLHDSLGLICLYVSFVSISLACEIAVSRIANDCS